MKTLVGEHWGVLEEKGVRRGGEGTGEGGVNEGGGLWEETKAGCGVYKFIR